MGKIVLIKATILGSLVEFSLLVRIVETRVVTEWDRK